MVDLDKAVAAYLAIRDARHELQSKFEEEDNKLKSDQQELEQLMLTVCNETNVNSLRTSHGTVMRKLNERFYCQDWENFRQFELEHPEYDMRERRIHQGNFRSFMEEHEQDGLPPGVSVMREFTVSVRRSS